MSQKRTDDKEKAVKEWKSHWPFQRASEDLIRRIGAPERRTAYEEFGEFEEAPF